MKNKLAGVDDLDDITATITEQRIHNPSLSPFELRMAGFKRKVSSVEWLVIRTIRKDGYVVFCVARGRREDATTYARMVKCNDIYSKCYRML